VALDFEITIEITVGWKKAEKQLSCKCQSLIMKKKG
jgi:hypothetical protein